MSLVIAANLTPVQVERLRGHPSRPVVRDYVRDGRVWDIPTDTELLITFARGWAAADRHAPPPGWPWKLKLIQVAAAGVDAFPAWFFSGSPVACGRGVQADAIAEYVLGVVLLREKGLDRPAPAGPADWIERPGRGVSGRTIGLLGFGAIGRGVAARALPFGADIVALRRGGAPADDPRIRFVRTPEEVAAVADHLVVALPLTGETRHIVDANLLAGAKPGLHLINVARGAHVDQAALIEALDAGRIGAATLDVTDPEPLPAGHALWTHPKVRLTPHSSGQSDRFDDILARKLAITIDRHLAGLPPLDRVDPMRGY